MYLVGWKCQSTSQFLVEEVHGHDHMKEALALLVTFISVKIGTSSSIAFLGKEVHGHCHIE